MKPAKLLAEPMPRSSLRKIEARAVPETALKTAAAEGRWEGEGWRVRKDGTRFWAMAVLDAVRDDNGDLIGYAKITRDITERLHAATG